MLLLCDKNLNSDVRVMRKLGALQAQPNCLLLQCFPVCTVGFFHICQEALTIDYNLRILIKIILFLDESGSRQHLLLPSSRI